MQKVQHSPMLDTDKVLEKYKEEGVKYVCTTEMIAGGHVHDIFFRPDPHPIYGNRYFGLMVVGGQIYIANADAVEDLTFGCILHDGSYFYSQHTHDFTYHGDHFIDGGRAYVRSNTAMVKYFKVKDGEFV